MCAASVEVVLKNRIQYAWITLTIKLQVLHFELESALSKEWRQKNG